MRQEWRSWVVSFPCIFLSFHYLYVSNTCAFVLNVKIFHETQYLGALLCNAISLGISDGKGTLQASHQPSLFT